MPVECDETYKVLPRPPERWYNNAEIRYTNAGIISDIIMLKLERPQFILDAFNWLKINIPLYNNITIDINNISANLTS